MKDNVCFVKSPADRYAYKIQDKRFTVVSEEEYAEAFALAESVLHWAEKVIRDKKS